MSGSIIAPVAIALSIAISAPVIAAITAALDVIFIAASMAFDAVGEVADAFLDVFTANVFWRVFVAAVAGIAAVVVAHMAGHATRVVVAVHGKGLAVVECGRCPFLAAVTLAAIAGNLLVQRIAGRLVTALALNPRGLLQQGVAEAALKPVALHAGMVAVARHAILTDQLLVKRGGRERLGDGPPGRGEAADIGRFVTGHASL